jgi:hypothetical protein
MHAAAGSASKQFAHPYTHKRHFLFESAETLWDLVSRQLLFVFYESLLSLSVLRELIWSSIFFVSCEVTSSEI